MKVLHLCLGNFFIDNYSYQENMLTKFHKEMGYEVEVLASLFSFDENGKGCLLKKGGRYYNEYNIPVTRLEYKGLKINRKLRRYKGTYEAICNANPDIIFIHGCQFLDIKYVVKYAKQNPKVKIYVDNHADFSNSARNFLSKNILHRIIWRYCAHLIEPYTTKFYGVLPARVDFLKNIYKLPEEKLELLVMGADDEKVAEARDENVKRQIRERYGIKPDDFLIMTGGKINNAKRQTLLLMETVKQIERADVKLIVFGSVIDELKEEINRLVDGIKIQYIGWVESEDSYNYFAASDLVVFPGRHSVFWEQVVGLGIPMIVKYWEGTTHIDLGGNCEFLIRDSKEELSKTISELINNKEKYDKMKKAASSKKKEDFLYSVIARKSICQDSNSSV